MSNCACGAKLSRRMRDGKEVLICLNPQHDRIVARHARRSHPGVSGAKPEPRKFSLKKCVTCGTRTMIRVPSDSAGVGQSKWKWQCKNPQHAANVTKNRVAGQARRRARFRFTYKPRKRKR
jgi:hypothetical protein